jgi:hypothetical protein
MFSSEFFCWFDCGIEVVSKIQLLPLIPGTAKGNALLIYSAPVIISMQTFEPERMGYRHSKLDLAGAIDSPIGEFRQVNGYLWGIKNQNQKWI